MYSIEEREMRFTNLCEEHLPIIYDNSIWRYSRNYTESEPMQGWKLHISASIESCEHVLNAVSPLLRKMNILYKASKSVSELKKLNCGLFYGYSQIGKFITIYPRNTEEVIFLAKKLYELTLNYSGPIIPFDKHYKGLIYYRYGAFTNELEIKTQNGETIPAIKDNTGQLVPDIRNANQSTPDWLEDPLYNKERVISCNKTDPISTTIKVFEVISQRGKGGVYKALNFEHTPVKLCILKEGRRYGELEWNNRDGYWRVKNEVKVLNIILKSGISQVPKVYQSFEVNNNYYAVLEYIEGTRLQEILIKKISISNALNYSLQITEFIENLHTLGWCWRDCKPLNAIVTPGNIVKFLDFEGACMLNKSNEYSWGTTGYIPSEWSNITNKNLLIKQDLYALGATMHHIFSSKTPTTIHLQPIGKLRRNVPKAIRNVIHELLSEDPKRRPNTQYVKKVLENAVKVLNDIPLNK